MLQRVPKHLVKPELVTVHESLPGAEVLYVFNEVDMATAGDLEKEINALPGGDRTVIDLSECRFVDSTTLGVLIRVYKRMGKRLRIVVLPTSQVDRVMRLTLLNGFLPISYSLRSALG
jgi:anti-anti-sigma factor